MVQCKNCKYRRRTEKYSRDFLCDNENSDFFRFYITADNSCELWTANKPKRPYIRAGQTANWREYHTNYMRERYQRRKAKGLCVICGEDTQHTKCYECREKYRIWKRNYRNRQSEEKS